jgi:hypothetical protein
MTLESKCEGLEPGPAPLPAAPAPSLLFDRLRTADALYARALDDAVDDLQNLLTLRYRTHLDVQISRDRGWLTIKLPATRTQAAGEPDPPCKLAERFGLTCISSPCDDPDKYELSDGAAVIAVADSPTLFGPCTVSINTLRTGETLLYALLDEYYHIPRDPDAA